MDAIFGVFISLLAFFVSIKIYKKTGLVILNPVFVSSLIIIAFLTASGISYDTYNEGGKIITFFLGPATIALAIPLYKKIDLLKKYLFPILAGVFAGSLIAVIFVAALGLLLKLDRTLIISLMPKSVTMPIGVEITNALKGHSQITILAIVITGVTGAITAPLILKLFRIEDPIAQGIGIGTSAHAIGTSKAMEMGEIQGAMSGLAIGIAGLMTAFIIPLIVKFFL